jgi:hypothetical protein
MTSVSPVAFLSYSWADSNAASLLHDELALRGFDVVQDQTSFHVGDRLGTTMADVVAHCDVYVGCLSRASLYLDDDPPRAERPVVDSELVPILARRRSSLGTVQEPVIVAVPLGLGGRSAASQTVLEVTGERIGSLWTPTWPSSASPELNHQEAAAIAHHAYAAYLSRWRPGLTRIAVATRGTRPPQSHLTIDATRITGGPDRRPGSESDWNRIRTALESITSLHRPASGRTPIEVELNAHLSGGLLIGRAFHQSSPWLPSFVTRHGSATPVTTDGTVAFSGQLDPYSAKGDLLVDIDLLGHNVATMATELAKTLSLGGRLSLTYKLAADLGSDNLATLAREAANQIRSAHATLRPRTIHICAAAPVAFIALLGHHLTALHSDLAMYEDHDHQYLPSLVIPPGAF